jgi:hypothetical protein
VAVTAIFIGSAPQKKAGSDRCPHKRAWDGMPSQAFTFVGLALEGVGRRRRVQRATVQLGPQGTRLHWRSRRWGQNDLPPARPWRETSFAFANRAALQASDHRDLYGQGSVRGQRGVQHSNVPRSSRRKRRCRHNCPSGARSSGLCFLARFDLFLAYRSPPLIYCILMTEEALRLSQMSRIGPAFAGCASQPEQGVGRISLITPHVSRRTFHSSLASCSAICVPYVSST